MCVAVFRLSCIQLKSFSGCQKTCGSDSSGTWRATFGEDSPTIWSSISSSSSASNFICCSCSNLAMNFWNRDGSIPSSSVALSIMSSEKSLMESEARQKEAKKGRRISRRWWGATMVVEGGRLQLESGENPYITKSALLWSALRRQLVSHKILLRTFALNFIGRWIPQLILSKYLSKTLAKNQQSRMV